MYLKNHLRKAFFFFILYNSPFVSAEQGTREVKLTEEIDAIVINHNGVEVTVERIQDTNNRLADDFTKTSRPCPPFCIHPIEAAPKVKTIGELELLEFVEDKVSNETGLLIDARMPNWYNSETIPGAVNIPFVVFTKPSNKREKLLALFGAKNDEDGKIDFSEAIQLTLFCNGPWCDQSPRAIKGLINAGYPAEKLHYYRGGMQSWKLFGLTTVLPVSHAVDNQ